MMTSEYSGEYLNTPPAGPQSMHTLWNVTADCPESSKEASNSSFHLYYLLPKHSSASGLVYSVA